jgi:hypothetical protein
MIQFNLLPDIKLEYVKARRTKYLLSFMSVVAGGIALAVFLFAFFYVNVVQKQDLNNLNADIKDHSKQLRGIKDLSKILTVQKQLSTLTTLHETKPVTSRIFAYIAQVTPVQDTLTKLTVDYATNTMSLGGKAPTLDAISVYTNTLKATKYSTAKSKEKKPAFSEVVLSNFDRGDKGATFTITLKYDPEIFKVTNDITLIVPTTTPTNEASLFGAGS